MKQNIRWPRIFVTPLLSLFLLQPAHGKQEPQPLPLIWQATIATDRGSPPLPFSDRILKTGNQELIAVDSRLVPLGLERPQQVVPMETKAQVLDAALDRKGNVWLGGRVNQRAWAPGGDVADAYIGKFSRDGRKLAELTLGGGAWRQVRKIQAAPEDGVFVAGPNKGAWLAHVSGQGSLVWERPVDVEGETIAIAAGASGRLAYLGAKRAKSALQPESGSLVFGVLDSVGNRLFERVVTLDATGYDYSELVLEPTSDGYFALAGNSSPSNGLPVRVVKISLEGRAIWEARLSHTAQPWQGRPNRWRKCDFRQAVLENGDLLLACSVQGEIVLSRISADTGAEYAQRILLPDCHEQRPALITPIPVGDNKIYLVGSRPSNNVAASCAWLAEWSVQKAEGSGRRQGAQIKDLIER